MIETLGLGNFFTPDFLGNLIIFLSRPNLGPGFSKLLKSSVLKLCTPTEGLSYFKANEKKLGSCKRFLALGPLEVTPRCAKIQNNCQKNSRCSIRGRVVAGTSSTCGTTCILQNEASPLRSRDIEDWSFALRLRNPSIDVTSFKWLGKLNAQFLKSLQGVLHEIFTIDRYYQVVHRIKTWAKSDNQILRYRGSKFKVCPLISPKRGAVGGRNFCPQYGTEGSNNRNLRVWNFF